jgi:hypothetical protein
MQAGREGTKRRKIAKWPENHGQSNGGYTGPITAYDPTDASMIRKVAGGATGGAA